MRQQITVHKNSLLFLPANRTAIVIDASNHVAANDVKHKQDGKLIAALIFAPVALVMFAMFSVVNAVIAISKIHWYDFVLGMLMGLALSVAAHQFAVEFVVQPLAMLAGFL